MIPYRFKKYNPTAFVIEERKVSKDGKVRWSAIKYPVGFRGLAETLVGLIIGQEWDGIVVTMKDINDLTKAYEEVITRVAKMLEESS